MENIYERKINKYIYAVVVAMGGLIIASAWYMRANAASVDCPELMPGDLFKVPTHSAVYLLNQDKRRMYFPHKSVYFSWYDEFAHIRVIPNACIDNYPSPEGRPLGVNYRFGSQLIKTVLSPSVYVIEPGAQIRKLDNEAIAAAMYGSNWRSEVRDLPDVFWANYEQLMVPVATTTPHSGMLIRMSGGNDTYFVVNGNKYRVVGTMSGNLQSSVQTVSKSVFDSVHTVTTTVNASKIRLHPATGMYGTIE